MRYLFDPDHLFEISKKGIGLPHAEMVRVVSEELSLAYPGHIETRPDWMFSLFGGTVATMTLLHASLREYILIFGSAIGTGGFSGRYWMEVHDYLMSGEMQTYTDDQVSDQVVTKAGERAVLRRERVKSYKIKDHTWMLEYGRGILPTAIPFGVGDAVFSCMDFPTVFKTIKTYGKLTVRELLKGKI